jgi:hypothetical protein
MRIYIFLFVLLFCVGFAAGWGNQKIVAYGTVECAERIGEYLSIFISLQFSFSHTTSRSAGWGRNYGDGHITLAAA